MQRLNPATFRAHAKTFSSLFASSAQARSKISNSSAYRTLLQCYKSQDQYKKHNYKQHTHLQKKFNSTRFKNITLSAGAALSTATQSQTDQENPPLTKDNIWKYRYTHKDYFIELAKQHIASKDKETIEAIAFLMETFPDAAQELTQSVLDHFNSADPLILKKVLYYNPAAVDRYADCLLTKENPHLKELLENYPKSNKSQHQHYDWHYNPRFMYEANSETTLHIISRLTHAAIKNPGKVTIENFNELHQFCYTHRSIMDDLKDDFSISASTHKQLRQAAIKHYGKTDAQTVINLYRSKISKKDLNKPLCIYSAYGSTPGWWETVDLMLEEFNVMAVEDIDYMYEQAPWFFLDQPVKK
jgi:hypothetical protein